MVRHSLEDVQPFLWAEAINWAAYLNDHLPHAALNGKTLFEALFNTKLTISYLRPFYFKCCIHIPEVKHPTGSKLDARALEGHLVGYTGSRHMFCIYIPSQCKIDTFRQVKFELSLSYTSVNFQTPSLPKEADIPLTTPIPL